MDYHHYSHMPHHRAQSSMRWLKLFLIAFIIFAAAAAGTLFYVYKSHPEWVAKLGDYREQVGSWLAERKKSMKHGIATAKKAVREADSEDRAVNFEFYNTLQDMKSMEADAQAEVYRKKAEQEQVKLRAENAENKKVVAQSVTATDEAPVVRPSRKNKNVKVSRAADLEKDILAAMKQSGAGE